MNWASADEPLESVHATVADKCDSYQHTKMMSSAVNQKLKEGGAAVIRHGFRPFGSSICSLRWLTLSHRTPFASLLKQEFHKFHCPVPVVADSFSLMPLKRGQSDARLR